MPNLFSRKLVLTTAIAGLAVIGASSLKAAEFNKAQTEAMGAVIKDYLMTNPEVIFEAVEAHRVKQEEEQRKQAENAIENNIKALTAEGAPSVGPADADVTVVEFFDYNCGYCKRAVPDIQAALKQDKKVRFVFKEMPILGPSSRTAAQWALAAHEQDKYFEYHVALMEHRGPKEEAELAKLAKKVGLDVDKMKKDANSDAIQKQIDDDVAAAQSIGISGTPAFIVGKTLFPGYIGEDGLMQSIAEERKKKQDG